MKKFSAVLVIAFISVCLLIQEVPPTLVTPVFAAQQGNVTGTFGINGPPTVNSVSLTQISLTPQTQYAVTVSVSDPDTINDLSSLVLKLYYDGDGNTNEAEFNSISSSAQNAAVITWTATAPGGSTYTGSTALLPAGTTWSLGTGTFPVKGVGPNPGDFALTTFTYQFVFTIGKVATQTTGAALWQVGVKATDSINQTSFAKDTEGASMNFYGEISVPATTVNWGQLGPGVDFTAPAAQKNLGVTVTYIANGAWDSKVSSGNTWTGVNNTATLDPTGGTATAQQFALKADDTGVLGNAVLVTATGSTISNTGTQTTETGTGVGTNVIWLRLAASFIKDVYQGTITYIIANHV